MAVRENQLTELTDISTQDYARIVTSGGSSARTKIAYIASTLLSIYKTTMAGKSQTVVEAIDNLAKPEYSGQGYGTCSTSASTTEKAASLSGYRKVTGGIVTIRFQYAVPANATLNINSTGAYPIYHKNTNITAGIINEGDICTFMFDGSQYVLIAKDSVIGITDYVISSGSGTAGDTVWTWRKWASGKIEAWGDYTASASMSASVWTSPICYKDLNISIPSGVFSSSPSKIYASSLSYQLWIVRAIGTSATSINCRYATLTSDSLKPHIGFYCVSS